MEGRGFGMGRVLQQREWSRGLRVGWELTGYCASESKGSEMTDSPGADGYMQPVFRRGGGFQPMFR